VYRFQFTSTIEDMLEAEEAERSAFLRKRFHAAIIVLGLVWLAAGLFALVTQPTLQAPAVDVSWRGCPTTSSLGLIGDEGG